MRSLIRYSLVAVGALALMVFTFAMLRPRLEPTAQAQRNGSGGSAAQVAGCNASKAPSTGTSVQHPERVDGNGNPIPPNPCLVISKFRENGPAGSTDEFVEIFNASQIPVQVSTLSNDPGSVANGIGIYVSAGQGNNTNINQARLACQIKGSTIILGRRWFLCAANGVPGGAGSNGISPAAPAGRYSLSNLGVNSMGTTSTNGVCTSGPGTCHSTPDATIGGPLVGTGFAAIADIPDDAGIALLDTGTDIVNQCQVGPPAGTGPGSCPSGFGFSSINGSGNSVVLDKVGFNPYGPGSPANTNGSAYPNNLYPNLAAQYCEGNLTPLNVAGNGTQLVSHNIGCLQPVGDASLITLPFGQPCVPLGSLLTINPAYGGGSYLMLTQTTLGAAVPLSGGPGALSKCYGESGQYAFARRRSGQTFDNNDGEIFKDSWDSTGATSSVNQWTPGPPPVPGFGGCAQQSPAAVCGNADDIVLETPIAASTNLGQSITAVGGIAGITGVAWPHNCDSVPNGGPGIGCTTLNPSGAPPIVGNVQFTQNAFDTCAGAVIPCAAGQLGPRNAERRYAQDPTIFGTGNDPFGTFILRFRYTNNFTSGNVNTGGQRWRIDDLSTNCGGQSATTFNILPPSNPGIPPGVGTQEARNLRGPDNSLATQVPTPTCQGEGSDGGVLFTALLKGVNHYGEFVVDSSGTVRTVAGSVFEDITSCPGTVPCAASTGPTPALQPFGGGSNSTWVVNTTTIGGQTLFVTPLAGTGTTSNGGDGVSGGTGSFPFRIAAGSTLRIAFKFGVVRSGRFKLFVGREVAPIASPGQAVTPTPLP